MIVNVKSPRSSAPRRQVACHTTATCDFGTSNMSMRHSTTPNPPLVHPRIHDETMTEQTGSAR